MLRSISSSAISHFIVCPKLYWYKFVEQKTPLGLDSQGEEGRLIHFYLDQHARGLLQSLPTHESETVRLLWNQYLSYIQTFAGKSFKSEWDFYIPYTLQDNSVLLTGRIDRLILEKDHLIILDWKTGIINPLHTDDHQMAFYAWCLWQMKEIFPEISVNYIDTRRVYLKEKKEKREVFQSDDISDLKNRFESVIDKMDENKFQFLPNPIQVKEQDTYCSCCYFQPICPGANILN